MKKLLLAAGVLGAMTLTASPAMAQRYYDRGHTSFSISIGSGYPAYGYGYSPYAYGYAPYGYAYPTAYPYYGPSGYYTYTYRDNGRRHHRHYRNHYRYYRY